MTKWLPRLYGFVAIHLIWYFLSYQLGANLIPYPHEVWTYLIVLIFKGSIFLHAYYSLLRLFIAIATALMIGIPIGLLSGVHSKTDGWLSPIVYILFPLPKIAFLPVFMALFGLGDLSKVILLFSVLIFQIILAARDGVKQIPIEFHHVAKTLRLTNRQRLFKLYLPSALPNLLSSLRISVGISMAVLFFGENYATTYGMGYYIMNNWIMVNYKGMFAGIIVLGLIAALLIFLIDILQKRLCPWLTYEKRQLV